MPPEDKQAEKEDQESRGIAYRANTSGAGMKNSHVFIPGGDCC